MSFTACRMQLYPRHLKSHVVALVIVNNWDSIFSHSDINHSIKIFKIAWNASILAMLWYIWIERNRQIFEDNSVPMKEK
ncbi:hypothetical protein Scep_028138 [Stephania cephalantha]|uniref:Uncharacterized protein n=1 Tax=Stephania cephalantha TaxID=152367 RepID=A0AAP0HLS9_9MAGN